MRKLVAVAQVTLGQQAVEGMSRPFDLVLGRKTYEIFAAHWPHDEGPIAVRINAATKHVASRTLVAGPASGCSARARGRPGWRSPVRRARRPA